MFRGSFSTKLHPYWDIQWDSQIPESVRREGYQICVEALNQGYREVECRTRSCQRY